MCAGLGCGLGCTPAMYVPHSTPEQHMRLVAQDVSLFKCEYICDADVLCCSVADRV